MRHKTLLAAFILPLLFTSIRGYTWQRQSTPTEKVTLLSSHSGPKGYLLPTDSYRRRGNGLKYLQEYPADYLIITTKEYEDELRPLVEWKIKRGLQTKIVTVEDILNANVSGWDLAAKVRAFINESYVSEGIKWVLLAGDVDDIPSREVLAIDFASDDGDFVPTDYYYVDLNGTWDDDGDHIYGEYYKGAEGIHNIDGVTWTPEVYVGRLSASNEDEMANLVSRIVEYEKKPPIGSWHTKAVLAGAFSNYARDTDGDDEREWLETDEAKLNYYIVENIIKHASFDYIRLAEEAGLNPTDWPHEAALTSSNVIEAINNGASVVNFASHGSEEGVWRKIWANDYDNDKLEDDKECSWDEFFSVDSPTQNEAKMPFFYIDACSSGCFDYVDDCLAEYILKNVGIGVVAATRTTWYAVGWGPDLERDGGQYNQGFSYRFWEQFFNESKHSPGEAFYDSKVDYLNDEGFGNGNATKKNLMAYNLLGDPEIPIWTSEPEVLNVTFSVDNIGATAYNIIVSVEENSTARDIPDAMVTLTSSSNLYTRTQTNASGKANFVLNASGLNRSSLELYVSKYGYLPKRKVIFAPRVSINPLEEWFRGNISLSGQLEDPQGLETIRDFHLSIDGKAWGRIPVSESWVYELPSFLLSDGIHIATVLVNDSDGLTDHASIIIKTDNSFSSFQFEKPSNSSVLHTKKVTVSWVGSDNCSGSNHYLIQLDSGNWRDIGNRGDYSFFELTEGKHNVTVEAVDNAGNTVHRSISFVVNTSPVGAPGWEEELIVISVGVLVLIAIVMYFSKKKKSVC
ncbi:MAG: hypothetical protein GWO20_05865 [Candidatus Korarchaeota archaeon]|nr:hypothetical protein [Candidatus Korarchaeota archaeon]NIU84783.1 hypothetical protein [Candidatus Thorarchaeota archaeon]NIW14777.1 hypothetical protein [Candidatus Thorarchaeota archaeon]NIW51507.1 hypothetical protein [Candidatus Korarchaeota archaeon]